MTKSTVGVGVGGEGHKNTERTAQMTPVRIQPLAASTAMLAAEHDRLDRAKAKLEEEIARMNAAQQVPSGDDLVRALAAEIEAEEQRIGAKREALARAEAALGTQERARREAAEQQRLEEIAADRQRLVEVVDGVLGHVEEAQGHLRAFVASINTALAAHGEARATALRLSGGARLPVGFSVGDLVNRLGGGVIGALTTIKVPGALPGGAKRVGPLDLPTSPHSADGDWRAREQRVMAPVVHELLNGRNMSNG